MNEDVQQHYSIHEDGSYQFDQAIHPDKIISIAKHILNGRFFRGKAFCDPDATKYFLVLQLAEHEQEVFACMFLDNQNRLISFEKLFYGTIDQASVYPREIVKRALMLNAAAVILAHNHPSGMSEPSLADIAMTKTVKSSLALIDVRVLDHVVVGSDGSSVSFIERGYIAG
ncbi:DNA repair protein RadC [Hahella sp. CR1]|uniref:RadC family protein n=1 Tax=Hahella sp. CR1 TaxID=2992807 RepID=UPI002441347E|nr:DNA repair protein RadC [Hahella sp. CR1]MDG9667081.1 DNA repair protein RadC [Hahella sp. CR1]